MALDTIPARFFARGQAHPDKPAYYVRRGGAWRPFTWREYNDQVRTAARAMIGLGLQPGQGVCILAYNRAEWAITAFAAMAAGGVPAGIYTTCSAGEVQYIVHHAEASLVVVEDRAQYEKLAAERDHLPGLRHIILMQGAPAIDDPLVLSWEQFLARAAAVPEAALTERLSGLREDDTSTYIYTSGTTGPPKAVMLSHKNILWTTDVLVRLIQNSPDDRLLSYLPLSHIAEQMLSMHGPACCGHTIYWAESLERVPDNLKEVQPTVFFGVPRIWEKFHAAVAARLSQVTGPKKKLFDWASDVARRYHALATRGRPVPLALQAQHKLARRLVFTRLKTALGLGSARACVSGAAPIAAHVLEFFTGLDVVVAEVYGQSEDCGPTSLNIPGATKFGSVGRPIPGLEVRLGEDGEILVRGPSVFKGYYKDPAATAEALQDGWLHSGDLGAFDPDGFLSITGRKKEIIITAGGKNIAPKNLEAALKESPLIEEAVVIGDRRKFLSALLAIDRAAAAKWLVGQGQPADEPLHENPALLAEIGKWVEKTGEQFARVEQVRKFKLLPRSLSADQGELTPTLKLKRKVIEKQWASLIEAMYEGAD
ncbi:long-chain acyl-CoA synthetase [Nannocystis exedens]|uniref:Long-chain acyl-CoA synthetase n=1 Tax=Nannocystis exedens TaxID=54 RepID=A0A1I1VUS1_9BACT|nr:long-chain fatty acid--CoA ligase [Nannocystis exedens]PCC72873.1 long-chain-fatty-acid-CoA ligase [Nannocystis exedens]SFD86826.1 long-chain acyl-CoA synthetase [Nannocystis exedens]